MKNKTLAVWLTLLLGPLGVHRRYLLGRFDTLGRLLPIPTLLGLYGVLRARSIGIDDPWSWMLMPLLGFTLAGCALAAIVYGLMSAEQWNRKFNPALSPEAPVGNSTWLTVIGLGAALMLGTTMLLASLAFSIQHYFEYQMEQAHSPPPSPDLRKFANYPTRQWFPQQRPPECSISTQARTVLPARCDEVEKVHKRNT